MGMANTPYSPLPSHLTLTHAETHATQRVEVIGAAPMKLLLVRWGVISVVFLDVERNRLKSTARGRKRTWLPWSCTDPYTAQMVWEKQIKERRYKKWLI